MAPKKTPAKVANAAPKAAPKVTKAKRTADRKAAAKKPSGPKATVAAKHGSKEKLVGSLLGALVRSDESRDDVQARLLKASNAQLLRLAGVVETVTKKYGGRDKLIAAISKATKSAKDKDYQAKLAALPLPRLLDLASSKQRSASQ
jgi:uncharacterized membrane protein YdfJ with MMPL/SSD domain